MAPEPDVAQTVDCERISYIGRDLDPPYAAAAAGGCRMFIRRVGGRKANKRHRSSALQQTLGEAKVNI